MCAEGQLLGTMPLTGCCCYQIGSQLFTYLYTYLFLFLRVASVACLLANSSFRCFVVVRLVFLILFSRISFGFLRFRPPIATHLPAAQLTLTVSRMAMLLLLLFSFSLPAFLFAIGLLSNRKFQHAGNTSFVLFLLQLTAFPHTLQRSHIHIHTSRQLNACCGGFGMLCLKLFYLTVILHFLPLTNRLVIQCSPCGCATTLCAAAAMLLVSAFASCWTSQLLKFVVLHYISSFVHLLFVIINATQSCCYFVLYIVVVVIAIIRTLLLLCFISYFLI